ncbi:hypothetical protein Tco_1062727, partial [Tanacetum coccineum]
MSTYLKHMGGYTYKQIKGKSFDEIQKLFDKEINRVNTFVALGFKVQESKEKKEEGREETAKGEEEKESEEVDEVELKKLLVIKKDEDRAIGAIPLATKLLIEKTWQGNDMRKEFGISLEDGEGKNVSQGYRVTIWNVALIHLEVHLRIHSDLSHVDVTASILKRSEDDKAQPLSVLSFFQADPETQRQLPFPPSHTLWFSMITDLMIVETTLSIGNLMKSMITYLGHNRRHSSSKEECLPEYSKSSESSIGVKITIREQFGPSGELDGTPTLPDGRDTTKTMETYLGKGTTYEDHVVHRILTPQDDTTGASMPVSTAGTVKEDNKDKAAIRLQEQLDEKERQRIARVHEEANSFNIEE